MQEVITWVSVKDGYPKHRGKVLTYGLGLEVEKRHYEFGWEPPSNGLPITHWAEMPKGPKNE